MQSLDDQSRFGSGSNSQLRLSSLVTIGLFVAAFLPSVNAQAPAHQSRLARFTPHKPAVPEGPAGYFYIEGITTPVKPPAGTTEAKTGFDSLTNGFVVQGPDFDLLSRENVVRQRSYNDDRFLFEDFTTAALGLGPTYNGQSCRECHENVVSGGASQTTELRTGHYTDNQFFEAPGGSLIQSRATAPDIVEHVADEDDTRTFRISTNVLGNGYVECIADSTLIAIAAAQPEEMRGMAVPVAVLEGDGTPRIGRFGWKDQHGSLLSFAADAYLNETGVTSTLVPDENTSSGRFVGYGSGYDPVPDPEPEGGEINSFADFMRATKAPARGPITADVRAGQKKFNQIGCVICHVDTITTASQGTVIDGGTFTVPAALADKTLHPYSDFLMHDIGTGDGIPILPIPEYAFTAPLIRTAPLWGLRTRNRLMHDGLSLTKTDAIARHGMEAASVTAKFNALTDPVKAQVMAFLDSL
jgi:CxxC motif-containing protein (DUF1111 family)